MKPFLYAALIQDNDDAGAGSVLYDNQQPLPGYACTDKTQPTATSNGGNCLWDDNFIYPGPETIRYALAGSRNVPAVKASYEVDPTDTSSDNYVKSINDWIDLANEAIGEKGAYACYQQNVNVATATAAQQTQCYGSAALGSGDTAIDKEVNGDVTFARLGAEIPQTYILNITDGSGKTVYQWQQPKSTQVYNPDTAYIINDILDDPKATYLQPYQKFQNYDGWDIAVKTGTENQEYNGVMTAWSTQYAVIGFAGYHTLDQPLEEGHFEDITEPITKTWMEQALDALHTKPINWVQPSNIKTIAGFVQRVSTGYGAEVPGPTDDVYPSWYTSKNGSSSATEKIDKVSSLLATSCTPADAVEDVGGASDGSFSIDIFYPKAYADESALEGETTGTTASATDNVHKCSDSPPTVTLTAPATCTTSCTITATATQGTHPFSDPQYPDYPGNISFSLGGKVIKAINITDSPSTVSFAYSPTTSGSGTLTATVTDSVLYQGTANATLNYSAPVTALTLTSPSAGSITSSSFTANWSGGTGPFTAYLAGSDGTANANSTCTNVTGTSCTVTFPSSGSYSFYIEDTSNNEQTTPITISGQ
jgi:membrane peptidoglycan carboxypeptidase